jgi:hypothetical protein
VPDDVPSNPASDNAPSDEPAPRPAAALGATAHDIGTRRALFAVAVAFPIVFAALVLIKSVLGDEWRWWQWALLVAGGLVGATVLLVRWAEKRRDPPRHRRPKRHTFSNSVLGLAGFFAIVGVLPLSFGPAATPFASGCGDPVELRVLLPEDGADGFTDAIGTFNEQYRDPFSDCLLANVTPYAASWHEIESAFRLGWEPQTGAPDEAESGRFDPMRAVGPRPDFMITESRTQIELATEALAEARSDPDSVLGAAPAMPIATTPLVLAASGETRDFLNDAKAADPDLTLSEMVERLGDRAVPVLRTNPAVSHSGALFLNALYGADAVADLETTRMENRLSGWAATTGVPAPATNADLLCGLLEPGVEATSPVIGAAVLTTEAALSRYNEGAALGEACPDVNGSRTGLFPVYGGGMGQLDYQAVQLDWDGSRSDARAKAANALAEWLAVVDAGDWHPTEIGLRDIPYRGREIEGAAGFEANPEVDTEPLPAAVYNGLQRFYGESRVDTSVLVAIDHSMSMEYDNGGSTRFELAAEAAATARGYLGEDDRMALWTFPNAQGASHTRLLPFGSHTGDTITTALEASTPHMAVELHQMMIDGAAAVAEDAAEDDTQDRVKAMVVLTDGDDEDDDPTVAAVHAALDDEQVALYVIAVGDVSCGTGLFVDLDAHSRVTCLDAKPDQLTAVFDRLYIQLWGIDD